MTNCIFLINFTNFDLLSIKFVNWFIEALEMLIWLWTPKLSTIMITTKTSSKLKRFDLSHVCDEFTRERMENVLITSGRLTVTSMTYKNPLKLLIM